MKRLRTSVLIAALTLGLIAAGCGRSGSDEGSGNSTNEGASVNKKCSGATLEATDVGVSADTITITVMADVGSPLAPGLFQGNVDAVNAFAKYVNANGGVGCRQLKVEVADSKLNAEESKNGMIKACQTSLAMVGGNALFNPDVSVLGNCADKAGKATGLPDFAALANDVNEQCAPQAWILQAVAEPCNGTNTGSRDLKAMVGVTKFYKTVEPNLTGIFMVPGDLPTTVQSATYQIAAQAKAGVNFTDAYKVSGRAPQADFNTFVQAVKSSNGTYVYNGSNDVAMTKMRKEAAAQGLSSVKVWACSLACYTEAFKNEGASVTGTYVWLQFIPFEEASSNKAAQQYVDAVGGKPDSFGAQAWQAAMAFAQSVDEIVSANGPNAITRAAVLEKMKTLKFDAGGWIGERTGPKVFSPCFVVMQANNGKFERVYPTKVGTLDCEASNIETVKLDPVQEATKVK